MFSESQRNAFHEAFRELNYAIIWIWDGEDLNEIPENVKTFKSRDYDSLVVEFRTLLANGTEFGLTSTEYLTLIEREDRFISYFL